jgi:hypothetical protein
MNPFIRLTLSRILTPLCKSVQPHRLAAFEWSKAMWQKVELAADPKKAAEAAKEAKLIEEAQKQAENQARAAQKEKEAVGDFGL